MNDDRELMELLAGPMPSPRPALRTELREQLEAELENEPAGRVSRLERPAMRDRRPLLVTAALSLAATVALAAVLISRSGDAERVGTVPGDTSESPTSTSTSPATTRVDSELFDALVGQLWISTEPGPWRPEATPAVRFVEASDRSTSPTMTAADGCNEFQASVVSLADGTIDLENVETTAVACEFDRSPVVPVDGNRIELTADRSSFTLFDGDTPIGSYVSFDAMSPAASAVLAGDWTVTGASPAIVSFSQTDQLAIVGTCAVRWTVADGRLTTEGWPGDPMECAGNADVEQAAGTTSLVQFLSTGAEARMTPDGDGLLLSKNDGSVWSEALRLLRSGPEQPDGPVSARFGVVFGHRAGEQVDPDTVLRDVAVDLGAPTHDTGWYDVELVTYEDGTQDCLSGRAYRVLWWGDLSLAFWRTDTTDPVLWAWSVGDRSVSGWGDRREPYSPPPEADSGLVTTEGLSIGSSEVEARQIATAARSFLEYDDGSGTTFLDLVDGTLADPTHGVIAIRDGLVVGFGDALRFC
ncbi:MAG: hypothetical protein R2705_20005 [Ilumatobacteraceae bacterium]